MPRNNQQIQRDIQRHRTAEITLTVVDEDGRPLSNCPVEVQQTRHRFLFGCNAYRLFQIEDPELQRAYEERFSDLLNFATLPFYWGSYEPQPGEPRAESRHEMARWCSAHGIRPKGHPLCWHEVPAPSLDDASVEEVETRQMERIEREVSEFAGEIDTWDVLNEGVVMPTEQWSDAPVGRLCGEIGAVELIKRCFERARAANPDATLLLNDYIVTEDYADLIEQCLDAGVEIDVIGIQSHQHAGYWGAEKAWEVCERFARFDLPLHFTETTLVSGRLKTDDDWKNRDRDWPTTPEGEARQAEQTVEFYRTLFSHPAVEAITWWDFSDYGAWMGAPAGFLRKDMTPKPAYTALHELIKDKWWTGPLKLTTDAEGHVRFRGYRGSYRLSVDGTTATFSADEIGKTTPIRCALT
jgi:GH35 family endo-1,4-beta-xylanase